MRLREEYAYGPDHADADKGCADREGDGYQCAVA